LSVLESDGKCFHVSSSECSEAGGFGCFNEHDFILTAPGVVVFIVVLEDDDVMANSGASPEISENGFFLWGFQAF
jgi:hypothetical protein